MSKDAAAEEAHADLAALITDAVKAANASKSAGSEPASEPAANKPAQKTEAEIAAAERTRIFAILEHEAAKERPKLALALAKSGLPTEAATGILAASPVETAVAAAAAPDGKQDALAKAMAKGGNSAGVKPDATADASGQAGKRDSFSTWAGKQPGSKKAA